MKFFVLSLISVIGIVCYVDALNLNHVNGKNQVKNKNELAVKSGISRQIVKGKSPTIRHPGVVKANIGKDGQRPAPVAGKVIPKSKSFVKPAESRRPAIARAATRIKPTSNGPSSLKKLEDALKKTEQSLAQEIRNLKKSNLSTKDSPSYDELNYEVGDYDPENYQ
ncbi:hypothetical protein LOTGIDRAFT_231105 [Lottia gigantea]|uniref:Uncharacterized protein n=1 Tax=Lottia gigantea TaxID=225164 RepID=V4CC84_LOTGI|nr:hypothetical protein LOTGIDRAFT_231105 [Lottia gigantea]ESO99494.1 hypothetical protein LOTGIDRAFT_231105 [Lottia gigantea]